MKKEFHNIFINKYNSDVSIIQDKNDKYKSYIMLDGYVIGVQVNTGTIGN